MSKLDINTIMSYVPIGRNPRKGDVFLRISDKVLIYVFGTCISMDEGEEGELTAIYTPLHGPYDTLYSIHCKELIDDTKYKFVRDNLDLKSQIMQQFNDIETKLNQ